MSLSSHLVELRRKHAALASEVESLERTGDPSVWGEIQEGKRRKLHLKDEIIRLSSGEIIH